MQKTMNFILEKMNHPLMEKSFKKRKTLVEKREKAHELYQINKDNSEAPRFLYEVKVVNAFIDKEEFLHTLNELADDPNRAFILMIAIESIINELNNPAFDLLLIEALKFYNIDRLFGASNIIYDHLTNFYEKSRVF